MIGDLGQPIAYGRTAEIYAWHPGQILKLFYEWFGLENIEHEARISRAIHASGLPTPAVMEKSWAGVFPLGGLVQRPKCFR